MKSKNWKMWLSVVDGRRCESCEEEHGKIYAMSETPMPKPPLHPWDRCKIVPLDAKKAGTATRKRRDGADWWLKKHGRLPHYYITADMAESLGWKKRQGNLDEVAPGKMLAGGIYQNRNGHLPSAPGRIWYEADINYSHSHRGTERVVYSNDGLIFVTYDHYHIFEEII
ncbi:MAG: phage head morphogenesis protein [Butyricicoccus sp.]|nr:phage head morphogenesis protein [Butyricicoccus sp.]